MKRIKLDSVVFNFSKSKVATVQGSDSDPANKQTPTIGIGCGSGPSQGFNCTNLCFSSFCPTAEGASCTFCWSYTVQSCAPTFRAGDYCV